MPNEQTVPTKDGWEKFKILGEVLSKVFIPIVVIVLPWFWSMYQTDLQKKQEETKLKEKSFDIYYKNISSSDPLQQNLAVGVLKMVDPGFATKLTSSLSGLASQTQLELASSIVNDMTQADTVRREAKRLLTSLANNETKSGPVREEAQRILHNAPVRVVNPP